jgi:hypothetical protein
MPASSRPRTARVVRVLRPTIVCAPSTVDSWLVCYDMADIPLNPRVTASVQTALAFSPHTPEVASPHTVCTPARP